MKKDDLTFRNNKGETYTMTREEFRNKANDHKTQSTNNNPQMYDSPLEGLKKTPEDKKFFLVPKDYQGP